MKLDFHFRRSEIIVIARRKDVADTDDLGRSLIAWFWHRPPSANQDPIRSLIGVAWRMGRDNFMPAEAEEIVRASKRGRPLYKADDLGEYLRLTDAERTAWGIKTIGGYDVPKRQRTLRRKRRAKEREAGRRRDRGARPQAQSAERRKPWKLEGVSRRTWYRLRQRETAAQREAAE